MMQMAERINVGTAGWSISRASAPHCPGTGTHLERYARLFNCTEINSSFHRPHAPATYAKWAASTPPDFRFAVKLPRTITHDHKLRRTRLPLEKFLAETHGLAGRRGPLLVQLPPSFVFDSRVVDRFFRIVRSQYDGVVVCEPRHPTWFTTRAHDVLRGHEVARVAADPACVSAAGQPGGWTGVAYYRLHGSPRTYWSRYDVNYLAGLASRLRRIAEAVDVWCVFDNTASGAAFENANELRQLLG